ncbi:MAG: signal peptide peptidase SppA [Alistipes sp.]|nr:signal peptide peptidase SppA [Alistipes sp.]
MKFSKIFLAALLAVVAAGFVKAFIWISIFVGLAGSADTVTVEKNSILTIDYADIIADAPSTDPFAGIDFMNMTSVGRISLYDALRAIDAAAEDDRIDGIYIRMNGSGGAEGWTILEELREALKGFSESGKFIVAYNDVYSQAGSYLASVADGVYLHPEGALSWQGMAFSTMFYKGLMDKLGVKAEIFRPTVCRYKSAVEPYFLDRMSDANRRQMQELADAMWRQISGDVAESRGIDPEKLQSLTDGLALCDPDDALKNGFVDALLYEDEMNDVFDELGAVADDEGGYRQVSFGDYVAQLGPDIANLSADRIAIVYAQGGIVDGGADNGENICGDVLAAKLREVRKNDDIKAVVLRVNSPGGSALASDVIWREMMLLREVKPVVVSMGQYAASGGYYISAPADAILADRLTRTGSIGVFGLMIAPVSALGAKGGITVDVVKTNRSADMGQLGHSLTAEERAFMMRSVDKIYGRFTSLVSEGRNLPLERVLDIAEGRVWAGTTAREIGLADANGGLKAAIAVAADKAGLESYRVTEEVDAPTGFAAVLAGLNASVRERAVRSELGLFYDDYRRVREAMSHSGVTMYTDVRVEMNH